MVATSEFGEKLLNLHNLLLLAAKAPADSLLAIFLCHRCDEKPGQLSRQRTPARIHLRHVELGARFAAALPAACVRLISFILPHKGEGSL